MSVCSNLSARLGLVVAAAAWLLIKGAGVEGLGVNWGDISSHPLPPKSVVKMLKANRITKVKLFDSPEDILNALAGSGIEVMIGTPNAFLKDLVDYKVAKAYVKENVTRYNPTSPHGVNITLVGVGNEPFLQAYKNTLTNVTYPALANMQKALNEVGIGKTTKATVPFNADVYFSPPDRAIPSAGEFRRDILAPLKQILDVLEKNDAPLMINVYPFLSLYYGNGTFPLDFAFFDGTDNPLYDYFNGKSYTNVFDANYDTAVAALSREGHGNLTVIVGEIGWPTDGDEFANASLAARFYNGFMKHLASNKGTPVRAGYIEVYMFGLFDEDQKSILPGMFERHWGILAYDGQPKFQLDLSGGNGTTLTGVPDIEYLPKKWCSLKSNVKLTNLKASTDYACDRADCTPLSNGSSCFALSDTEKVSYSFNAYFQAQNQADQSCDFNGLAEVTTKNFSSPFCNFTIGISLPVPPPAAAPPAGAPPSKDAPTGSQSSSHSLSGSRLLLCRGVFLLLPLFFLIRND